MTTKKTTKNNSTKAITLTATQMKAFIAMQAELKATQAKLEESNAKLAKKQTKRVSSSFASAKYIATCYALANMNEIKADDLDKDSEFAKLQLQYFNMNKTKKATAVSSKCADEAKRVLTVLSCVDLLIIDKETAVITLTAYAKKMLLEKVTESEKEEAKEETK